MKLLDILKYSKYLGIAVPAIKAIESLVSATVGQFNAIQAGQPTDQYTLAISLAQKQLISLAYQFLPGNVRDYASSSELLVFGDKLQAAAIAVTAAVFAFRPLMKK